MPSPLTIGALGTSLGNTLKGSTSSSGSTNSAKSISYSNTAGREATSSSNLQAQTANNTAMNAWREAAEFNSREAAIQREWQERMANTVYQRSVSDMKKAGINPILAAGMGLGTASVGSGATASITNPEVFMGQSFAEQNSAMNSQSHGSSWNNSESGLATGLQLMGEAISGALQALNSGNTINIALQGLDNLLNNSKTGDGKTVQEHKKNGDYSKSLGTTFKEFFSQGAKGIFKDIGNYMTMKTSGGTLHNKGK